MAGGLPVDAFGFLRLLDDAAAILNKGGSMLRSESDGMMMVLSKRGVCGATNLGVSVYGMVLL